VTSLDKETGRDRYFAAKERELDELLDPDTGMLSERHARTISCPLCGADSISRLFVKRGYTIVRCDQCDLVYANPQVDEGLVLDAYREGGSSDLWVDVLTSARQLELDREKFSKILDELEPYRGGGRLLDVGCSIGLFLQLAEERGWKGVGTELGKRALAYARDHYEVEVVERLLADAGFDRASFDVVTLNSVLEHTHEPRQMLRQVGHLLEPGGALYVIVPNVESLACRVLHERAATFDGRNHLIYFSPRTLREALEREGFQVVDTHTRISSLTPMLEWTSYQEPYSDGDTSADPLARELERRADRVEALIEELDLGYKLHCLAVNAG
jgi:2-polyprenyl-3-methyl-5-hydroxy-6-metoxy-1,4-benzoquinol methylase